MALFKKTFFIVFLICSLLRFSCEDEEKDEIKLLVTCDGDFHGDFILNGGNPVGFGDGLTGTNPYVQSGSIFYFSIIFDDLDFLEVNATRTSVTDTLRIRIYREGVLVKTKFIDESSSTINDLGLNYDYDEESSVDENT